MSDYFENASTPALATWASSEGLPTAYTDPTHDLPVHDNQQTALAGYGVRV